MIFARGECLQTLDMNQDMYLGEAYKMRNLLEGFRGNVHLVGFREHIFSESGGAVAGFAAGNELVFGTMVRHDVAAVRPLPLRPPRRVDKLWQASNGGVSKASRTLHVSEDIFGGINVILRGGSISYEEFIHCGKGRDMGFIAVNGFEQKVSTATRCSWCRATCTGSPRVRPLPLLRSTSRAPASTTTTLTIYAVHFLALSQLVLLLTGTSAFHGGYRYWDPPGRRRRRRRRRGGGEQPARLAAVAEAFNATAGRARGGGETLNAVTPRAARSTR